MQKPHLIIIAGPTGSGKTRLAIEVAKAFNTEIISFDSRQFYREMDIGVARPSPAELAAVKHHFIAAFSVHEPLSAGAFADLAREKIDSAKGQKDFWVLTGGSGLYLDALLYGFDELPKPGKEIREKVNRIFTEGGLDALIKELKQLDPAILEITDIRNPARLKRALEVCYSGYTYSELRKGQRKKAQYPFTLFGIDLPRTELYDRINRRVDEFLDNGLEEEVRKLFTENTPLLETTVGYKEWLPYLKEGKGKSEIPDLIRKNSRNYAKRQMTWFRKVPDIVWISGKPEEVFSHLKKNMPWLP